MFQLKDAILKLALAAAGTLAMVSHPMIASAATVEIVGLDFESGNETVLASGDLRGEPRTLLGDLVRGTLDVMIDECGSAYLVREDKRSVEFLHPEAAYQDLRLIMNHERAPRTTIFGNGQAYEQRSIAHAGFDAKEWEEKQDQFVRQYNAFGTPIAGWPEDRTFVAAGRLPGIQTSTIFVVDEEGTLFGVASDASGLELKPIGEAGAHEGTVSLLVGRGKIFTLRQNGRIFVTHLGKTGWGDAGVAPQTLGPDRFPGATVLRATGDRQLVAISGKGRAYVVDAKDGALMSQYPLVGLRSADAAELIHMTDRFDHRVVYDVAYARVSGEFGACLDKPALLARLAETKEKSAERAEQAKEALAQLDSRLEAHRAALDAVEEQTITIDEAEHMIAKSTLGDRVDDLAGQVEAMGETLDAFEESHLNPLLEEKRAFLGRFGTSEGTLASDIESSGCCRSGVLGEIDKLASTFGSLRSVRARGAIETLNSIFSDDRQDPARVYYRPALSKKEMAAFEQDAENRRALYEQAREAAEQVAEAIDAEAPQVASFLIETETWFTRLDEALDRARTEGAAQNAKAVWPSRIAGFQGPGDPDELEKVALGFVQRETGDPYFEAHICRGWQPIQRDALGRVKDYAISMCMVRADEEDPDFARTVWVVLYTVGAEMAPPFSHVAITEKTRIVMDRREGGRPDLADVPGYVPNGGGGSGGGWPGAILRMLTGFALLGTGTILAGRSLARHLPSLTPVVESLEPHAARFGQAAFGIGVLGSVGAIVTLSPIANTIPIVGCLVTGLLIWRPSTDSVYVEALPERLRTFVERVPGMLQRLAVRSESLGRAALALAPIHLLLGGLPLV